MGIMVEQVKMSRMRGRMREDCESGSWHWNKQNRWEDCITRSRGGVKLEERLATKMDGIVSRVNTRSDGPTWK